MRPVHHQDQASVSSLNIKQSSYPSEETAMADQGYTGGHHIMATITKSPPVFYPVPQYPRPSQNPDTIKGPGKCSWYQCITANGGSIRPDCPPDCGFHPRWRLPQNYQACGPGCGGAHYQCVARERPNNSSGWINYVIN